MTQTAPIPEQTRRSRSLWGEIPSSSTQGGMHREETLCERRGGEGVRRVTWLNELVVAVQELLEEVFTDKIRDFAKGEDPSRHPVV